MVRTAFELEFSQKSKGLQFETITLGPTRNVHIVYKLDIEHNHLLLSAKCYFASYNGASE